tara:strand:+ start:4586 stop:4840 length:255 start_codon:yes stop_codon:yes gene_type:complete
MKKSKLIYILGIVIIFIILFIILNKQDYDYGTPELCNLSGGKWITMGDSCVDSCFNRGGCDKVLTDGCNCGKNKCWTGKKCINE